MSEAVLIRLKRARSWLDKASASILRDDIDAQFILLWISFNALYGTPRYHHRRREKNHMENNGEIGDFKRFLRLVENLSSGELEKALVPYASQIEKVMQNPFLDIEAWRKWDSEKIRDRQERFRSACNVYSKRTHLDELFLRFYILRNQLLHGSATDQSGRNRESLKNVVPILRKAVQALVLLADRYGEKIFGTDPIPFPPSLGEGGQFNPPRIGRDR
ncbi:HEPN domain-containing protein [Nitrospira sp. KM1]|uniref:HEPN domain-containing protein n=1 Tax=Nitrospira sp. KM1 TaxID=1936990 RepID=UPI001565C570|nr:HEPN domain-containing protein [Nitrospira sp. KM1]